MSACAGWAVNCRAWYIGDPVYAKKADGEAFIRWIGELKMDAATHDGVVGVVVWLIMCMNNFVIVVKDRAGRAEDRAGKHLGKTLEPQFLLKHLILTISVGRVAVVDLL